MIARIADKMNSKQRINQASSVEDGDNKPTMAILNAADISKDIGKAIAADAWETARLLLQSVLEEKPDDHWLLPRLALTY